MTEFVLQGAKVCVHPCRNVWAPGKKSRHRKTGKCPAYGEAAGLYMVAHVWQTAVLDRPYGKQVPGFDNSMILPLEIP